MPHAAGVTIGIWTGQCCCHSNPTCISMTGRVLTGSPNVFTSGVAQSRLTDITIGECGHTGRLITGSSTVFANGIKKGLVTSLVDGCNIGRVIQGDVTHDIGL
jgi:uncharacterized Zn-binding protein involved in type VI secretion